MKIECNSASFEKDPEGIQLAEAINVYLPPEVNKNGCAQLAASLDMYMLVHTVE